MTSNGRHRFAVLDEATWSGETDPIEDLRRWARIDWGMPYLDTPAPVHPRFAPAWSPPVAEHIARLLPAPRPPAEVVRHHALLAPEVQ
jgi:hypothetical protein